MLDDVELDDVEKQIGEPSEGVIKLAAEYLKAKDTTTCLEKKAKDSKLLSDHLKIQLFNQMESEGIESFKTSALGLVYTTHRSFCDVIDPDRLFAYLKEVGLFDDLTKLEVRKGRLNDYLKAKFTKQEKPIPEIELGISVNIYPNIGNRGRVKTTVE